MSDNKYCKEKHYTFNIHSLCITFVQSKSLWVKPTQPQCTIITFPPTTPVFNNPLKEAKNGLQFMFKQKNLSGTTTFFFSFSSQYTTFLSGSAYICLCFSLVFVFFFFLTFEELKINKLALYSPKKNLKNHPKTQERPKQKSNTIWRSF